MSTLKNAIHYLLGWDRPTAYNRVVNANTVLFSSFGKDVTASDIVKTAIHRVCEEVSKCSIKSVTETQNPHRVTVADDDINSVLLGRVNPMCGLKDFLYKIAYITLVNRNCFIYWAYDEVPIKVDGKDYVKRVTRGFYPLEKARVKLYYAGDEMRAELQSTTGGGVTLDLPYSDLIHLRLGYGANPYLGGDADGRADWRAILKNLQTLHVIQEAIPKSLEASLSLHGVLTMNTVAEADKREISRKEFEKHLFNSELGIVATDYESQFTPIQIATQDIPQTVLTFLRDEILSVFGVSVPIYLGKYTDDDFTAFYQTAVEPLLMTIVNAMKITLFTSKQLAYGRTIKFYDKIVQSLSFARRLEIAKATQEDALLSRPERRELLGYDPDDEPTRVSLNYIDVSIANTYQLTALSQGKKPAAPKQSKEDDE